VETGVVSLFLFRNIKVIILLFHTKFIVYSLIICSASEIEKNGTAEMLKPMNCLGPILN